jgi:hypothetical protein
MQALREPGGTTMSTGRAGAFFIATTLMILGGCASSTPRAILTASELDAMIRVEVEQLQPVQADDTVVAALQP